MDQFPAGLGAMYGMPQMQGRMRRPSPMLDEGMAQGAMGGGPDYSAILGGLRASLPQDAFGAQGVSSMGYGGMPQMPMGGAKPMRMGVGPMRDGRRGGLMGMYA